LTFSESYIAFLIHFHGDRDYFECHEVLEDHWKNNGMARDSIWVGLIQMAVSFYHYRRGNVKGSLKLIDKAIHLLSYKKEEVLELGINYEKLIKRLKKSKLSMKHNIPYKPIIIPINDLTLLAVCKDQCVKIGCVWGHFLYDAPENIVHKHTLRDRASIIPERQLTLV